MRRGSTKGSAPQLWTGARMAVRKIRVAVGAAALDARVKRLHGEFEEFDAARRGGLYTREKLLIRMSHRDNPGVRDVLHRWWRAAQCSFVDPRTGGPVTALTQDQYVSILIRTSKALVKPEEYDAAEVEEAVRDDWEMDSQGQPEMSRELYMDAIFELCAPFPFPVYLTCPHPSRPTLKPT